MYCPQCGQTTDFRYSAILFEMRVSDRGWNVVLGSGGQIPTRYMPPPANAPLSARSKGVRQGAMLMLSTLLVVPLMAIITVNLFEPIARSSCPMAALFCFVGGSCESCMRY